MYGLFGCGKIMLVKVVVYYIIGKQKSERFVFRFVLFYFENVIIGYKIIKELNYKCFEWLLKYVYFYFK